MKRTLLILTIVSFFCSLSIVNAQKYPPSPPPVLDGSIDGPQDICLNQTYTYTYTDDLPTTYYWAVTGGNLLTSNTAGLESINAEFTSSSGSVELWYSGSTPHALTLLYQVHELNATLVKDGTSVSSTSACLSSTVDIKVNSLWGTISGWQSRSPGGTTWAAVTMTTLTTNQLYRTPAITADKEFRAVLSSTDGGNCTKYSNTFSVTLLAANSISGPSSVEEGYPVELELSVTSPLQIKRWEFKLTGTSVWQEIPVSHDAFHMVIDLPSTADVRAVVTAGCTEDLLTPNKSITVTSFNSEQNGENITNENFVKSFNIKTNITSTSQIPNLTAAQRNIAMGYMDGLGRTTQQIAVGATPDNKDMVAFSTYEQTLQPKNYLPYKAASSTGTWQTSPLSAQSSFYSNGVSDKVKDDTKPYSIMQLEASPLGRLLKQGAPGAAWQLTKPAEYLYKLNTTTDAVMMWKADGTTNSKYAANLLYKNEVKDEQGNHILTTFTDKAGRTILQRKLLSTSDFMDTYYVYDEKNRIIYVIPPRAVQAIGASTSYSATNSTIASLIFSYSYDDKGRLEEKKTPDAGIEYIVYDKLDRPVMVQDANLRSETKWMFVKYDMYSRPVLQGWIVNSSTRQQLQTALDALNYSGSDKYFEIRSTSATFKYYSNQSYPVLAGTYKLMNVTYYDDYDYDNNGLADSYTTYTTEGLTSEGTQSVAVRGFVTRTLHNILGTSDYEARNYIYDAKGRAIQVKSNNAKYLTGQNDRQTMVYNFDGSLKYTKKIVKTGTNTYDLLTVLNTFIYDNNGRLVSIKQKNNSDTEQEILNYEYNALGQLVDKKLHVNSTTWLQSVDYRYNIRGWLESINNTNLNVASASNDDANDLFGLELIYNTTQSGVNSTALYNGNISAVKWKEGSSSAAEKKYSYVYDRQNRLTSADYSSKKITWGDNEHQGYDVKNIAYDKQGNITGLDRYGWQTVKAMIDDLSYTYNTNSNKLMAVNDASQEGYGFEEIKNETTEYTYDGAGNISKDENKGISGITYNELNKVKKVTYTDGRYEEYTYNATGERIKRIAYDGSTTITTWYVKGGVYNNGYLDYFEMPEGRVYNKVKSGTVDLRYEYYIKDHQGNIRMTLNSEPEVISYTATMETVNNDDESKYFINLDDTRVTMANANQTVGGDKAARLDNTQPIGPTIALEVNAGDKIKAEAYAYYEGSSGTSNKLTAGALVTALAATFGITSTTTGEGGLMYDGFSSGTSSIGVGSANDNGVTASIIYLIFDKNFNYLDGSITPVGTEANYNKSLTQTPEYTIKQAGYVVVYVSNATDSSSFPVHFDDLKVTYTGGPILQTNNYYPFGMLHAGSGYRGVNPRMYNGGSEQQPISGNYSTWFREYDPGLGRFMAIDIKAAMFASESPYHYSGNDPINYNDPLGDRKVPPPAPPISSMPAGSSWYKLARMDNLSGEESSRGWGSSGGGWNKGITNSDWNPFSGSNMYRAAIENGFIDLGNGDLLQRNGTDPDVKIIDGVVHIRFSVNQDWVPATEVLSETNPFQNPRYREKAIEALAQNGGNYEYQLQYQVAVQGDLWSGINIRLNARYTGDKNYVGYNWFQTIKTNVPREKGMSSPYIDSKPKSHPFYYTSYEASQFSNKGGWDIIFDDSPRRANSDLLTNWVAELSLMGQNSDGTYERIFTVSYGFFIINGQSYVNHMVPIPNPSNYHLNNLPQ